VTPRTTYVNGINPFLPPQLQVKPESQTRYIAIDALQRCGPSTGRQLAELSGVSLWAMKTCLQRLAKKGELTCYAISKRGEFVYEMKP